MLLYNFDAIFSLKPSTVRKSLLVILIIFGILSKPDFINLFTFPSPKPATSRPVKKFVIFAEKTSTLFVKNIPKFLQFHKETKLKVKLFEKPTTKNETGKFYNKKIVFTGVRNKELEKKILLESGEISNSLVKNTFILIVKNKDEETTKIQKAKKLNITIMTIDEFNNKYF